MPTINALASVKIGVVRRKLKIRRVKNAAALRRGLRLKAAPSYKIHDYLALPNDLKNPARRKSKPALRRSWEVAIASVS